MTVSKIIDLLRSALYVKMFKDGEWGGEWAAE